MIDEERVWEMLFEELRPPVEAVSTERGRLRHTRISTLVRVLATDVGAYYSFEADKVLIEARHRMAGGEPRR